MYLYYSIIQKKWQLHYGNAAINLDENQYNVLLREGVPVKKL